MTKQEFIDVVAKEAGNESISKTVVRDIIDTTFAEMVKVIKAESRFAVPGFGTFTVRERAAKTGRNPKTGDAIKIKASKTIGFKPAPSVKETL